MNEDGWRKFLNLMVKVKDPKRLNALSKLLFTPEERNAISKRIPIIDELIKGKKTQREMAEDLEISIAKITRGSNALKETPEEIIRFLKKVL